MVKTVLEYRLNGGEWLGTVRRWIQSRAINGEACAWGSDEILKVQVSVADMEDLAAEIGWSAAREEHRRTLRLYTDLVTQAQEALVELKQQSMVSHVHNQHGIVQRLEFALKQVRG